MPTIRLLTPHAAVALAAAQVAAALLAAPGSAWAQGRTVALATTGQSAPGPGGGTLSSIPFNPSLNDAGQVSFFAGVSGSSSTEGLFRASVAEPLGAYARLGQSAPGAGSGTFSDFFFSNRPPLNELGQVVLGAGIAGGSSNQGIYRIGPGSAPTAIALQGQAAGVSGGGTFSGFFNRPQLNNTGQVAFSATIAGGNGPTALYRGSQSDGLTVVAQQNGTAPGTGGGRFASVGGPALNEQGQIAFRSDITGGSTTRAVYRSSPSGSTAITLTALALQGQAAPGAGGGSFADFSSPRLNNAGQAAFIATINGGSASSGIYRSNAGTALTAIALQGQAAPGTNGGTFSGFSASSDELHLGNSGQVVFRAPVAGSSSSGGLFRSSAGTVLTALALEGQVAPGTGSGVFEVFGPSASNEVGLTAFAAVVTGGSGNLARRVGLFISDGQDIVTVQLEGSTTVGGQAVVPSLAGALGPQTINGLGQVAYSATLSSPGSQSSTGVLLFTPTLRWRSSGGGSWEDASRWMLGINPGAVHDVNIDAANSLRITGPTGAVNLRSLRVGTGSGVVTLDMAGGSIDAADSVLIGPRGVLSGTGSFARQVINQGTVQPERLVMSAGFSNAGLLRGVAGGPTEGAGLEADLLNQASGRVLVQPGETLQLRGTTHRNLGSFEVNQGRLELAGSLLNGSGAVIDLNRATVRALGAWTNAAGASLLMGEARLTVSQGLSNAGRVLVTSGDSDVFGPLVNQAGGQVVLSGRGTTTFYDAVELQGGGELRVSAGATAVFFGAVRQRNGALMTGTGLKYFEGGLSVGDSPGLGEDAGSVAFGTNNLYLAEIGGTALGTGYDHYRVSGTLTLGGTLKLVSFAGFTGQAGDSFDLFDWGTLQGQFTSIDSSGLLLAEGLQLDVSRLYVDGVIGVTAVPEPGTWALMLAGAALLLARRRHTPHQGKPA